MNTLILKKRDNAQLSGIDGDTVAGDGASITILTGNKDTKVLMAGVLHDISLFERYVPYVNINYDMESESGVLHNEDFLMDTLRLLLMPQNKAYKDIIFEVFYHVMDGFKELAIEDGGIYAISIYIDGDCGVKHMSNSDKALFLVLMQMFVIKNGIVLVNNFNSYNEQLLKGMAALAELNNNRVILETQNLATVKAFLNIESGNTVTTIARVEGSTTKNCELLAKIEHEYTQAAKLARIFNLD